jgi:hypothetical protein
VAAGNGDRVSSELGTIGLALGKDVSLHQGFARAVAARDLHIRQGGAGSVVAGNVTFEGPGFAGLVVARKVEGRVRALMDWRGALVAGAAFGLVFGLIARRKRD